MEWLNQLTPQQRAVANKVAAEADRQGVPRELALAAAMQESKFNQKAKSKTGPVGVMQLGKAAANEQGVNRHNLDQNIKGGVGYLKQMLVQQNGDPQRALIAYHDGPSSPFFKGGSMSPEAYNHLQKVKSYGGFQGDVIPMATNTPTGVTIADIDPVPDIPLFTAGETVGRPRDARDVAAGVAGAGLGAKFGQNVMPSHREQQLMQAARRLDLLESKQAIDAANAAKVRTFGGDVANWHPGQYREDISRNIINPSSQADAAEQARQLEARAKAAQRFGQTVQAGPESRIQIPVEAGGGPRGGPPKTPMPTSVIPEAPVPPAAGEAKPFLRSARFPGGGALNVLGGAGAAAQLYDAYERYKEGDYPGAALGAISGVGGGVGTFFPNPVVQAIGGGVGLAGAGAQYLYDKYREDQDAKKQQAAKPNMAEGGLARLPKFAGRGESLVKGVEAAKKAIGFAPASKTPAAWTFGHSTPGKMSDWAQNYIGQHIVPTQADRMGGVGGPSYSANQLGLPQYQGRAWGSGQQATASGIANLAKDPNFGGTGGQIFAPLLGSENMHQSNQIAFDKLLREFYRNKASLTPEKQAMINEFMRTGGGADRKTPLFDPIPDFDIANKRAVENLGQTFDTRKAIAEHAFGGTGMGKTKAQIFDYQGTLDKIRDPHTVGAPSFAIGPRAFRLTGDVEATPRPDLNLAYPYQLHGEDLGVTYTPVPSELSLMDFQRTWREHTGKKEPLKSGKLPQPGYYEHTLGYTPDGSPERIYPRQQITEEWIKELQRSGFADGGMVNMQSGGSPKLAMMKALASKALPAAERKANLEKFLTPSQEKRVMYHGSLGDINKFNPNNRITFLTPEPSFANSFASKSFDPVEGQSLGANPAVKPGANVMPVHVQAENIFNPYKPSHLDSLYDKLMQEYGESLGSHEVRRMVHDVKNPYDNWQAVENDMIQNAIKDLGHDAFVSTEAGVQNLGVYDPRRIKSAIGNEGTYNTRDLDVTKAEGGLVHLQAGGNPKLAALKAMAAPAVDRLSMHFKDVTKRIPQLQDAAMRMKNGEPVSREEYEMLVNAYKPVKPFSFVPKPATKEEAINALTADKKGLFGAPSQILQPGQSVGLRLDIPAYSDHGVWVPAVHEKGTKSGAGTRVGYESVASVNNPVFNMSDKGALSIASGKPKSTIATIEGGWNPVDEQTAIANAQRYLEHPDWRQVGMDPERHGYFYDRASMEPVLSAEEALQIGPLVLARKPVYGKKEDFGFAKGGLVNLQAGGNPKMAALKTFADPAAKFLKDWSWKPMPEVASKLDLKEVPDYIQGGYGQFMKDQAKRAAAGDLSARDLIKAYTITQSSIGRGGLSHATATKAGLKLPNTGGEVRPEGAFAEWLGSPMGQRYLDTASKGQLDPKALAQIQQQFAPFGKQNDLIEKMQYAAQTMPNLSQNLNQAILGDKDMYRNWAEQMKGVAGAKSGFIGSMLGRGDLPTFDARQINLHTANQAPVGIGSIMNRGKGQGGREAVDRLAARQEALGLDIDPALDPFYQHLTHHAVWDRVGNNQTTHDDLVKAMRDYKEGGLVGLYANIHAKQERIKHGSGEKMRKPGTEGAPTAEAFRESAKTAKMKKGGQVNLSVGRGEKLPVDQGAGLTAKGRAKYNRETGSHLKAPQPEGGPRKDSFCARMQGVVDHAEGDAPRAKAALKRWKC